MIRIDGSEGEGGGQILRTSLALSLATGTPFTLTNVRAGRKRPGLLRQHLTCVNAAAEIGGAEVAGAEMGSREVTFRPGAIRGGFYRFAVGSAGSACLVLQSVLPALLFADQPTTVTVEGGTHNPFAPPADFLARSFLPLLGKMGAKVALRLDRAGFYPAGGGSVTLTVEPVAGLRPLELLARGPIRRRRATAMIAHLPRHVGERELAVVKRKLGYADDETEVLVIKDSPGPGNVIMIEMESDSVVEIATGFGETNVRAEAVAERAVKDARRYLAHDVPVGKHLADQLLLPLALAGGGVVRTLPLSRHTTTNAAIVERFLGVGTTVTEEADGAVAVAITGAP